MKKGRPKPLDQLIQKLNSQARFVSQAAEHRYLPPTAAAYAQLAIHPRLQKVLQKAGIERLWSHQQEGIAAIRREENVVVMTPTANQPLDKPGAIFLLRRLLGLPSPPKCERPRSMLRCPSVQEV